MTDKTECKNITEEIIGKIFDAMIQYTPSDAIPAHIASIVIALKMLIKLDAGTASDAIDKIIEELNKLKKYGLGAKS